MSAAALALLARSDGELVAAQLASDAGDRLVHAHLAAIRAAAAVLAVRGRPGRRSGARTVWEMLSAVAPELRVWAAYFMAGAAMRSAVETGRSELVDPERAEAALAAAEDFRDAVQQLLDSDAGAGTRHGRQAALLVRAS